MKKGVVSVACCVCHCPSRVYAFEGFGWLGLVGGPGISITIGPRYGYYGYRPYEY
jgi:hypothetical protein